jgi:hypothetical protein
MSSTGQCHLNDTANNGKVRIIMAVGKWNNEDNDKNDVVYFVIALYLQEEVNS